MKRLIGQLRRTAEDILNGRRGKRAQALAWTAASIHPALRAARLAQRGDIHAPLQILQRLQRSRLSLADTERLRTRLADMATFCEHNGNDVTSAPGEAIRPTASVQFNGKVMYALHSCGAFDPSGYAARSVALVNALKSHGVVPIITTRPGYPWDLASHRNTPKSTDADYQGLRFRLSPDAPITIHAPESRYIDAYAQHLANLGLAHGVSVIHAASNYLNGAAAALAGRKLGVRSIYEVRGLWHLTRAFAEPDYVDTEHYRYCEKREVAACEQVDHVITISAGLKQWLTERGIAAEKITIIGNAAHPAPYSTDDVVQAGEAVRRRLAIPPSAKVVGYLGAIVEYEGLDALLRAHARTPADMRPFLLFVGSGKHEPTLKSLAARLGTASRVVFAGRVTPDQVSAHYAAMDALMLPRRDDVLTRLVPAIKPFEILAHGRPLFVSPSLAQALGDTLPGGYQVIDLDSVADLNSILAEQTAPDATVAVPTWPDRAHQVLALYQRISTARSA